MFSSSARTATAVVVAAVTTVITADLGLQRIAPLPPHLTTLDDGLRDLERHHPDVLVFGSSHTRSFAPLQALVGRDRLGIVTMESGWAVSFEWVLEHRLAPLLDAHPVQRAILPLTFSDVCGRNDHSNIPRNGWHLGDLAADLWAHGITEDGRTYLTTRTNELFARSLLVQRGAHLLDQLKRRLRTADENAGALAATIAGLQQLHFLDALDRCPAPDEVPALDRVVADLERRGAEVTLILFPLPARLVRGLPPEVLARYRAVMAGVAARHHAVLADWATAGPFDDGDFMDDLDHLDAAGNRKLVGWALAHELRFLVPR